MPGEETTKATLNAVAQAAGVTVMTLSRYFRSPDKVAKETKARIAAAISELGYVPDASASRLAGKKRPVLVMVVPSLELPYVAQLFDSVAEASDVHGAALLVMETQFDPAKQEKKIEDALSWRPDGIIFAGDTISARSRHLIKSNGARFVEAWAASDDVVDVNIGLSHKEAARRVAAGLVDAGYRRIAFAVRLLGYRVEADRLEGYREAMREADLPTCEFEGHSLVSPYQSGADLFSQAWQHKPRPDAVFFAGDLLAVGALFEAQRSSIHVPDHIAVCGFGDYPIAREISPSLSTVRLPIGALGRAAVDACFDGAAAKALDEDVMLVQRLSARLGSPADKN